MKNLSYTSRLTILLGLAALAGFAALSSPAATILESPQKNSQRTKFNLDIVGINWDLQGNFFNGLVRAKNQTAKNTRLSVVIKKHNSKIMYRKTVDVPAGQSVEFPVFSPNFGSNWGYYTVEFIQEGNSESLFWTNFQSSRHQSSNDIPVIKQRRLDDLYDDYRLYLNIPSLSIDNQQWGKMSETKKEAMLNAVEMGSHLNIRGLKERRSASRERPPPVYMDGQERPPHYGHGQITNIKKLDNGRQNHFQNKNSLSPKPSWDVRRVPAFLFIPFVLIFALLIGPGTIWYSRKKNRPGIILFLIPGISLVACVVMLVISLLHDGIRVKICRQSIAYLDQVYGHSTVFQLTGIEAPLGIAGSVKFPERAIVQLPLESNRGTGTCFARGGLLHCRGFVLARTPTFFSMVNRENRREKLAVKEQKGQVTVTNGLGASLKNLLLRDSQGNYWSTAKTIPPGKECNLSQVPNSLKQRLDFVKQQKWLPEGKEKHLLDYAGLDGNLNDGLSKSKGQLARNSFQVELSDNVFGVDAISSNRLVGDNFHFLIGNFKAEKP